MIRNSKSYTNLPSSTIWTNILILYWTWWKKRRRKTSKKRNACIKSRTKERIKQKQQQQQYWNTWDKNRFQISSCWCRCRKAFHILVFVIYFIVFIIIFFIPFFLSVNCFALQKRRIRSAFAVAVLSSCILYDYLKCVYLSLNIHLYMMAINDQKWREEKSEDTDSFLSFSLSIFLFIDPLRYFIIRKRNINNMKPINSRKNVGKPFL